MDFQPTNDYQFVAEDSTREVWYFAQEQTPRYKRIAPKLKLYFDFLIALYDL